MTEHTTAVTATLLDRMFGGGPESVIAVLLVVIAGMGLLVWQLIKWNLGKESQLQELNNRTLAKLQQANKDVSDALIEVADKHNANTQSTIQALSNVQLVLAELKGYVTVLGNRTGG